MRLRDRDIKVWLDEGRLSITPPPKKGGISGISVDLHLGNKFRTFNNNKAIPLVNLRGSKEEINQILNLAMNDEINLKKDEVFHLPPGGLVLAITIESITLPDNLVGWLDGRSSLARLGLMVHLTAHRIDPGWSGCIVLEFLNVGKLSLALHPGMKIGALSFEKLAGSVDHPYKFRQDAKFYNQKNVVIDSLDRD